MKTLPDSPSLDHLRQQGKDLLVQLRRLRPDATLAEAQRLVAGQYGFRTWPELKAEVARRSAAGPTAEKGTEAMVAAAFDLGAPRGPLVAVERQWAGQAWSLETDRGRWLARRLFDWFDESALEAEVLLAESAAAMGIKTLRPVRSKTGAVVETVEGFRWRVYDLPALGPEPSVPADPRHAAAAGRIVARVHNLRLPAPQPVQQWLTFARSEEQWWGLHAAAESAGKPWAATLAEVIPAIVEVSGIVEPPAEGGAVLSACHFAPNTFRVVGGDDLAVVSWEHAGAMPPRWDLGGTLAAWSEGVLDQVNAPAAKAVLAGYGEEAEIPRPLDLGMFSAMVCGGLNWLASRIKIALTGCDGERREQAERAVPWLLERPPSLAQLRAVLDAAVS